jgi:hypothetical protein
LQLLWWSCVDRCDGVARTGKMSEREREKNEESSHKRDRENKKRGGREKERDVEGRTEVSTEKRRGDNETGVAHREEKRKLPISSLTLFSFSLSSLGRLQQHRPRELECERDRCGCRSVVPELHLARGCPRRTHVRER